MSIPADRLQEILCLECLCALSGRISKLSQNMSCDLSLLYITKCVKSAHVFLNRMLQLLRDNTHNNVISLTQDFYKDLHWFNFFIQSLMELQCIIYPHCKSKCIWMPHGRALGFYKNYVYALSIPLNYMKYNIAHLEMVNVVVAL